VRLALDPQMYYSRRTVWELPDIVARLEYDWMELSPKADFIPFFKYPRVDDAGVRKLRKIANDAGVGIASVLPVLRWSGPDEDQRQAAVRAWKRALEITVDLGVEIMNSEFNGRPEAPETAEAQFLKSLDELLPLFEREGVQLILEPHPDDFIEDGLEAVGMIRGLNRDWLGFLYCAPHAFHQGHPPATIIEAAGDKVRYVHLADAFDHRVHNGLRYIVNPPGSPARVHQHAEMRSGEVDFDEIFAALAGVGFDGVISSCVFGWEEDADGVNSRQREKALALVAKHFGADAGAVLR
jgi:myo-inositol catabolism protein IolH